MATRNIMSRAAPVSNSIGGVTVWSNVYDAAVDGTCTGGTDIVKMFSVPAGTVVLHCFWEVITTDGSGVGFDIGVVGGDLDGFVINADANSAAFGKENGALFVSTADYQGPVVLSANTEVQLTGNSTDVLDTAKIKVWLVTVPLV